MDDHLQERIRRPRLEDVARHAGVSPITVSRSIRNPESVSAAARAKIALAIDAVGYVPNQIAGSLASNQTKIVAVLVPSIGTPFFGPTIEGLNEALSKNGLYMAIGDVGYSPSEEERLVEAFLAQRPCGMYLHQTTHTARVRKLLAQARIPVVEAGSLISNPIDVNISYSNVDAARAATLHLGERGYRKIAFLSSSRPSRTKEREEGYRQGLKQLNIPFDPRISLSVTSTFEDGGRAIRYLIETYPDVDAAFFSSPIAAVGALLECQRQQWPVPQRIAIASFDDSDLAAQVSPALTAIRLPRYEVGRQAGQYFVDCLNRSDMSAGLSSVDLGFQLIQRGST
jgi:LacI family gluconate utilization system Gnt-I transcriptional repressor